MAARPAADVPAPDGRHARRLPAAPAAPELTLRPAGPADLASVLHVDSTVFGLDPVDNVSWLEPLLSAERAVVALAELDGEAVGTAYTLRSDGSAGPALYLAGVAVLSAARRRGVGAALSSWLLERGFAAGADFAHLNPDTDEAARIYERLGFVETPGLDIYVDIERGASSPTVRPSRPT